MRWLLLLPVMTIAALHFGVAPHPDWWLVPRGAAGTGFYVILPAGLLLASARLHRLDATLLQGLAAYFCCVALIDFGAIQQVPFERITSLPRVRSLVGVAGAAYAMALVPFQRPFPVLRLERRGRSVLGFLALVSANFLVGATILLWINVPVGGVIFSTRPLPWPLRLVVALVYLVVLVAMLTAIFGISMEVRRQGRRWATVSGRWLLEHDPRRPILVLRAFRDDADHQLGVDPDLFGGSWQEFLEGFRPTPSMERVLADGAGALGPIVALARPTGPRAAEAIPRLEVAEEAWQRTVLGLADRARLVLFVEGESAGMGWELTELVARGYRDRLCFLVPPYLPSSMGSREEDTPPRVGFAAAFEQLVARSLRPTVIGTGEETLFLRPRGRELLQYRSRSRTLPSYRKALRSILGDLAKEPDDGHA